MVSLIQELGLSDRPLYVDGVNGLTIEHLAVDARRWHLDVPTGIAAVVAVDEGQRLWRPRGPGQRVPDDIQAMETHRHGGLDFFITTQSPKLLDTNLRELCGRHVHIRDLGILGRWWYEWPEAQSDPKSAWKSAPIKKKYSLDRKAFALYKSASLHVKPIRSFPWVLAVLGVAVIVGLWLAWTAYGIIKARVGGGMKASPVAAAPGAVPGAVPGPQHATVSGTLKPGYLTDATEFTPRLSGNPETAPAYDELRRVVVFPQVVGGWCQGDQCYCINQQGRDSGISVKACRQWLASPPFDPYHLPPAGAAAASRSESVPKPAPSPVPSPA